MLKILQQYIYKNEKHLFFFLSFSIFSCQTQSENPLVAKYNAQYQASKRQLIANKSDITRLIQQLPFDYQAAIYSGITAIEKHDLTDFLKKEKVEEEGLLMLFQSVDQFLEDIEATRNFKATTTQTEMYNLYKNRLIESKSIIVPYIAACEKSKDPNQLSSGLFLKKVMQYDINGFVQNTFIGKDEFEKTFKDVNENWEGFIDLLMMENFRTELPRK